MLNWSIQSSPLGEKPKIISEYILNEMGIFIKRELRMPMNDILTATTGFRIGYEPIKGTDYRAAPYDRNAILWHKITNIVEENSKLIISGNRNDVIEVYVSLEDRSKVLSFISDKIKSNPPILNEDKLAASWMCWRDDDEWEVPYAPLSDMIRDELDEKRFIEDDILEDTVLKDLPSYVLPLVNTDNEIVSDSSSPVSDELAPKFCSMCGTPLQGNSNFCGHCGVAIKR